MTHVSTIFPVEDLEKEIDAGNVRFQSHPSEPLWIYNYTESVQYNRYWNDVTLNCRGLILDAEMNIIARPWKKFFNFGERPLEFNTNDPVEVTDKKDGSLGILYKSPITGSYAIATRGSFMSDQAIHATKVFNDKYSHIVDPIKGYTYLFEIVYPENRIVLDYGSLDDLIILGAVHNERGWYSGPNEATALLNWPGPETEVFPYQSLNECFGVHRVNAEGLVIRAGNRQVKMKQADYVALHKIVTGLNERRVWELMKEGQTVEQICEVLPDEFHQWVKEVHDDLTEQFRVIYHGTFNEYIDIKNILNGDMVRKHFAQYAVKTKYPSILFNYLDNRSVSDTIWDLIKPEFK